MIRISDIRTEVRNGQVELSAQIESRYLRRDRLWFRWDASETGEPKARAEPFLSAMLIPAMTSKEDIRVAGPISPELTRNYQAAMELLVSWNDEHSRSPVSQVRIESEGERPVEPGGGEVGLFFSGGVDSFYSALAGEFPDDRPPTSLIFVNGFDLPSHPTPWSASIGKRLREVSARLGFGFIGVSTNVRYFTDPLAHWGLAHGPGLASVGHALGAELTRVQISATDNSVTGFPAGVHPDLVPLFSSEAVEFVDLGGGVLRSEKLELLASHPIAREHVRVCWENSDQAYNFGRCSKCLRNTVVLYSNGWLKDFTAFPPSIRPADFRGGIEPPRRLYVWRDAREKLADIPGEEAVIEAIDALLDRNEKAFRLSLPGLVATGDWRACRQWLRRWIARWPPVIRAPLVRARRWVRG